MASNDEVSEDEGEPGLDEEGNEIKKPKAKKEKKRWVKTKSGLQLTVVNWLIIWPNWLTEWPNERASDRAIERPNDRPTELVCLNYILNNLSIDRLPNVQVNIRKSQVKVIS